MFEIDHVAAVTRDLDAAVDGMVAVGAEHVWTVRSDEWGYETAYMLAGDDMFTLITPFRDDSFMADYLESRGEGLHHLGVNVEDLDAAVEAVTEAGAEVIMEDHIPETRREATIHPGSWFGLQIQFIEWHESVGPSAREHIEAVRAAKTGDDA